MNQHARVPIFILAGGLGTRLSEETTLRPKPMVEIGDTPILVHIMRRYYAFGFNDFVICAGYRAWEIKNYFLNYQFRSNHLEIDHRQSHDRSPSTLGRATAQERWRVRVIDTGEATMTGGRVARAFDEVTLAGEKFDDFGVTYGDGVCDVDLSAEFAYHQGHGQTGTVLAVRPMARFGELAMQGDSVLSFSEKPEATQGLINGGFFFFKRAFRDRLKTDESCILERDPVSGLARDGQLRAFTHPGFWHPMDTLRDKNYLQELWTSGKAPWVRAS